MILVEPSYIFYEKYNICAFIIVQTFIAIKNLDRQWQGNILYNEKAVLFLFIASNRSKLTRYCYSDYGFALSI